MTNGNAVMTSSQTLGLSNNWLDYQCGTYSNASNCIGGNYYWYPYVYPYVEYRTVTVPTKIRLKLSEVERLREAAHGDEALRATLQKFTPYIEIEVDF